MTNEVTYDLIDSIEEISSRPKEDPVKQMLIKFLEEHLDRKIIDVKVSQAIEPFDDIDKVLHLTALLENGNIAEVLFVKHSTVEEEQILN